MSFALLQARLCYDKINIGGNSSFHVTIYFDGYQCGKCGAEFDALGIDHEGVKRQILADARNAYPQFKDSVSDMWMV